MYPFKYRNSNSYIIFIIVLIPSNSIALEKGKVNSVVQLDPYISILDKDNRFRYNATDLLPMVKKVATKFNKVYIQLSEKDLMEDLQTSLTLLPSAIAIYDTISNSTPPLQIWLAYEEHSDSLFFNSSSSPALDKLLSIADQSNGTVTTILIPPNKAAKFSKMHKNSERFKIGTLIDVQAKCNKSIYTDPQISISKLVLFQKSQFQKHQQTTQIALAGNRQNSEIQSIIERIRDNCFNDIPKDNTISSTFIISISDTMDNGLINMSRLISLWEQAEKLSRGTRIPVIISKAFDTPYESTTQRKTDGRWRLVENPNYNATTDYIFEDKMNISNQFERESNFVNITWLQMNSSFSRENTGIIFSLFYEMGTQLSPYSGQDLKPFMEQIAVHFSKFVVLIQESSLYWLQILPSELDHLGKITSKFEAVLMLLPGVELHEYFFEPFDKIANEFEFPKELLASFILPYSGSMNQNVVYKVKKQLMSSKLLEGSKFGYLFSISICGAVRGNSENETYRNYRIRETLNDADAQVIYFYFEEEEETVKLGAKRMFSQRTVEFDQCRKFLRNQGIEENSKEIRFIMLHYATDSEFYENAWALQNLVRYWEMLSNWAESTNTTVILNSVFDVTRIFKRKNNKRVTEVGWWRQHDTKKTEVGATQVGKMWLNKREEAVQVLTTRAKRDSNLPPNIETVNDVILVILLPLAVCGIVIAMAVYLLMRHYRYTYVTKREMDEFFLGNENVDNDEPDKKAHNAPYDKDRYEIDRERFEIDKGPPLGCGEFGMVCRGKVEMDGGTVNVAIKMGNPDKLHKTTIQGMLSEIKVLAYLGKHENVTELIGANTAELKNGKVLIFLELCQLGSLEKYLRTLRPETVDGEEMDGEFYSEMGQDDDDRYTNMVHMTTVTLDQALSDDLYRWSTEICCGMAYLASKHVVHADLATRNVLLNLRKEAKLCDFGLSRKLYNYTNYVKKQQEPLPWKWMSPEALRLLQFNEKSDVWAFGVTLWEIYSLGDSPYPGLSFDISFAQMLESGFRLGQPKYNDRDMYTTMKKCWSTNPAKRPMFSDLLVEFQ